MAPLHSSTLIVGAGYTSDRLLARLRATHRNAATLARSSGADFQIDLDNPPSNFTLPKFNRILYLVPPAAGRPEPRLQTMYQALTGPPQRLVLASTSGVYGDCDGRLVDESEPLKPGNERAIRRVQLEQTAIDLAAVSDFECVVLRIAGIYGPGRLPLEALARGVEVIDPVEANPGNRIHVDDLAAICEAALYQAQARGIYNVADGDHRTTAEYYAAVAEFAAVPPPRLISRAAAKATFSAQRYSFMADSRRLDVRRLREQLGVEFQYPTMEAGILASLPASNQG